MPSPRSLVLSVAIAATLAAGAGFGVAQLIESPEEAAARVAPPAAAPITVPIELTELVSQIVTRADIAFDDPVPVTITASGDSPPVVTGRLPEAGAEVTAGGILLEVTGRPVIVLPGKISTYRTLVPGAVGPDVRQLQEALIAVNKLTGEPTGTYDAETAKAVRALYADLGYPAPESSVKDAVTQAEEGVTSAQAGLTTARSALAEAGQGPLNSQEIAAQNTVNEAAAALQTARTTGTPPDEAAIAGAQSRLAAAETAWQDRSTELATAKENLAAAEPDSENARQWQAEVDRLGQVVQAAAGEIEAAKAALAQAQQPGSPDQNAINAAQGALNVAQAQLRELRQGPDTTAQQTAVTDAEALLAKAQQTLTAAQAAADTPLPAAEIVFLDGLPRRVGEVTAKLGAQLSGAAMTVSGATLNAVATLSSQEAELLQQGGKATITLPGLDPVEAALAAPVRGADGTWTAKLDLGSLTPEQVASLTGANVKVTVPVGATKGKVLVVPVAALFADSNGDPRVEIMNPDGTTRFQPVEVGLTADGLAEINPVDDTGTRLVPAPDTLDVDSQVVVGR